MIQRSIIFKKKILVLTLSIVSVFLSGCSSITGKTTVYTTPSGTTENTADLAGSTDTDKESKYTLSIYIWDTEANRATLQAAEEAYQQYEPDFKLNILEADSWSDIENRLSQSGTAGDDSMLPDLTLMQDRASSFMLSTYPDLFQDISESQVDWSNFPAEKADFSTVDHVHYAYPYDNSTCIAAYRTDILAEAGYTIDDLTGITWDRWLEIGKDVYEKTGMYLLSVDSTGNDFPFIMMQEEGKSCFNHGEIDIANDATMKSIMEFFQKGIDDHCIYYAKNWTDYIDNSIKNDMVCGAIAGTWIIPTLEADTDTAGNWAVTTLPSFTGQEGYASNGGSSIFILSSCKGDKKKLAIDFLDYTIGGGYGAQVTYERGLRNSGFIASYLPCQNLPPYKAEVDFFGGQTVYIDILSYQNRARYVEQSQYYYLLRSSLNDAVKSLVATDPDMRPTIENALATATEQTKYNIENHMHNTEDK